MGSGRISPVGRGWITVLELGAEGETLTVQGKRTKADDWVFTLETDESALADFDEELQGLDLHSVRRLFSWDEVLKALDHYRWLFLCPQEVHPSFKAKIAEAFQLRANAIVAEHSDWNSRSRWKALLNPPPASSEKKIQQILELFHDPLFVEFEMEQQAPSIFNAVGRTHTETWHSAFLGWLFDAAGSHNLGDYPLRRLLLVCAEESDPDHSIRLGVGLHELLAHADLSQSISRPNEREPKEVSVDNVGNFDVFIDGIAIEGWKEVNLLIETKVRAKIDLEQCQRYIQYIHRRRKEGICTIPVFLAPTDYYQDEDDGLTLFGSEDWIGLDYQKVYDAVIQPSLSHVSLSPFGRTVLTEYVKTLKSRHLTGKRLVMTQKERDLAQALQEKHGIAIEALYEILSEAADSSFQPLGTRNTPSQAPVKVRVGDTLFEAPSIKKLYLQVLKYLFDHNHLQNLELPVATGGSRQYILANEPKHPGGNDFWNPVGFKNYYMEANKSRAGGLRDLARLLEKCNLPMEVIT